MPTVTSHKITYEFDLEEIKNIIARHIQEPVNCVSIEYVKTDISSDMERTPRYEVTHVIVTVDRAQALN